MARIVEDIAKKLLGEAGLPVPRGRVARGGEEAAQIAAELGGPVVVKALVPASRRGIAGGVLFAQGSEEARDKAEHLLGRDLLGYPVRAVLVEERVAGVQELFFSIAFDSAARRPVILAGGQGGVDVESHVQREGMGRLITSIATGPSAAELEVLWRRQGVDEPVLGRIIRASLGAWEVFRRYDLVLLETNPLLVTSTGQVVVASAIMQADEEALFRQPRLQRFVEPGADRRLGLATERERLVAEADRADPYRGAAKFIELGCGDIAFLVTGGGGSLTCFDLLRDFGGRPANYVDLSPGFSRNKLEALMRAALTVPGVRGALVGGAIKSNMAVDLFIEVLIEMLNDLGLDPGTFPVVARVAGLGEERALALSTKMPGLEAYGRETSLEETCRRLVDRLSRSGGEGRSPCAD